MGTNDKQKLIGISIGVGVVGIVSVFGYWYYDKMKKQAKMDELMASRSERNILENYNKLSRFAVNGKTFRNASLSGNNYNQNNWGEINFSGLKIPPFTHKSD